MLKFIVIDLFNNGQNLGIKTDDELIIMLGNALQTERQIWNDNEQELSNYPPKINKFNYKEWAPYFAYEIKNVEE